MLILLFHNLFFCFLGYDFFVRYILFCRLWAHEASAFRMQQSLTEDEQKY
jgi:hypothetical protein